MRMNHLIWIRHPVHPEGIRRNPQIKDKKLKIRKKKRSPSPLKLKRKSLLQ